MSLIDRFLNRIIRHGTLELTDHQGRTRSFGTAAPGFPDVAIRLADKDVASFIALHPRLGAGEAYMDGRLIIERGDIMELIQLVRANAPWDRGGDLKPRGPLRRLVKAIGGRIDQINPAGRSQRNVAHHYDLDDRLYDLFLDADKQYSCAYFTDPANSLEQAQDDKKAHIAAKLALRPGLKVLDIGCGWGGMALYLNRIADVDVLGITLSQEQLKVARRRAEEAGVAERVKFELIDYRALTGRFDRIVSVGMFEHVGVPQYETFFRQCRKLLAHDGVMLLHTIGRMGGPGSTDAFTTKYIFPGGYIPALSEIVRASEPSRLIATDVETLRLHYAHTLRQWYQRTVEKQAEIEAIYDARFFRMWTFYLAGATAAFEHGGMCNYQVQFARSRHALPITRDYMAEAEAQYRSG
ncbi:MULTISPECIES: cyclopropane-fatty-acyl-phospholipid synthase family protein [Sphingomonadales]|jgi:cyclopropane-fatty-acyl-phospholipid synthase|uniref:SAM-dependent methyltransferase n=1 Tax=Sphingomonadales TaxID=204457 RepID=UPI0008261826|nr:MULTISPECIES: cyclopropane-fatty-acyl-phospholipid synthase family protein [Sphingomonadales]MAF62450.1 class I SAM-dependent methyltransferase [Blastomonas sp.]|tara:strand:- start:151972 stop:153201 length:1230 start_codon:yes stop_codon:yes gene_type:complete